MNREQAKQLLPIIQAFADGEDVQSKIVCETGWADISYPDFDPVYKWRIKPKPLERWIVEEPHVGPAFLTRQGAEEHARGFIGPMRIVHMIEDAQ